MYKIDGAVRAGFEPVRAAFEANFARGAEAGAAVAVYLRGRPVVDLWGGVADPAAARQWDRDTLQVVYSTTKAVTAACAHLLVQRGQLDLDAPVAAYWPEFAAAGKERIPVRWLLSHRAGLPALDRRMPLSAVVGWDPMVRALAEQAPAWEPGTAHGYHALTYGWLVGELVRRVSGRSLGTFLAEEIAAPLGLDLWIGLPPAELPRVSRIVEPAPVVTTGHPEPADLPDDAREMLAAFTDPTSLSVRSMLLTEEPLDLNRPDLQTVEIPAVNGICTARALARFYAGLIGAVDGVRILDPETLAAATTEQASGVDAILKISSRPALGFGLPTPDLSWWSPTAFGHPGHGGSLGYADPATGVAFGYVMNRLGLGPSPDTRAASLVAAVRESLRAAG